MENITSTFNVRAAMLLFAPLALAGCGKAAGFMGGAADDAASADTMIQPGQWEITANTDRREEERPFGAPPRPDETPSPELIRKVQALWDAAEPDKKWNALFYTITGNRFDAKFQYEEDWDPAEHEINRRPRVLEAKYGNKPVDYSDP